MKRRPLGARRERQIREGLAPGAIWIGFPERYARQLLRELDLTRRERDEARAALDGGTATPEDMEARRGGVGYPDP